MRAFRGQGDGLGHPEGLRTILGLPIAKVSFEKMKFIFRICHSERSEESRSCPQRAPADSSLHSE
jgi:hypothetical protein